MCRAGPIGHFVDIGLVGRGHLQRGESFTFRLLLSSGSLLSGEKVPQTATHCGDVGC